MPLLQLIYASHPFGFDDATLGAILLDARRCNARDDITGMLICRADLYLQLLEGPERAVEATCRRIMADDRHVEMRVLSRELVGARLFPQWSMRDDPARSWLWTKQEVESGRLDAASQTEIQSVFQRLAGETAP
ncbi:MAG: BLUF domain-containing protein [Pseudomonadota bacterium]